MRRLRERYGRSGGSKGASRWRVVEYSEVPTLVVRLRSGDRLRVEAEKSSLETTEFPRTWRPEEGGPERFAGIGHGDLVTVLGQVERQPTGALFRGWIVYGGRSLADLRRAGDDADGQLRTIAWVLVGAGLGLLAVFGFGLRRRTA